VATRLPRKTLLVFCEGERTEPEYLNALKRERSVRDVAAVDIRLQRGIGGSAPMQLVSMAIEAKRRAEEEEGEIDEFWCVFDVESPMHHPRISQAVQEAQNNGVNVAVSNPCFELWLILHLKDQASSLSTRDACRLRRKLDGAKSKEIDPALYMPFRHKATNRAIKLDRRHLQDAKVLPKDNPSSGMHRLLAAVESTHTAQSD
jgi:hypothetical protein